MRNPTVFRAQFSGLIMTVFGKEQVMKYTPVLEMYQESDSPERWRARARSAEGMKNWVAASPEALARLLEEAFVERLTEWTPVISSGPRLPRPRPQNVISIDQRKRA